MLTNCRNATTRAGAGRGLQTLILCLLLAGTAGQTAAQVSVTFIKLYNPGETVELFRGHEAELQVDATMTLVDVSIRLGTSTTGTPLPGANVTCGPCSDIWGGRIKLNVASVAPGTPLGNATIVLKGPVLTKTIPVRFTDVGEISSVEVSADPARLNEELTVTVTGHGLENVAFCGTTPTGTPALSMRLRDVEPIERTPNRFRFRATPFTTGPLTIGADAFKHEDLSFCPGSGMPWGPSTVAAETQVLPNPVATGLEPARARPGDFVRITGEGFFDQTSLYEIGVTFREIGPGTTGTFSAPLPTQRAPGDQLEFQIPPGLRDSELELSYATSGVVGSFRVPVPGPLLVDRKPVIDGIAGQDGQGLFAPGRVLELNGQDLLDRDGIDQTRIRLADRELSPDAQSSGHAGARLLVTLPADLDMWTGPVFVAHSGGEVQSADEIMIAGPPSVDAVQRRAQQITWCQAPGQPVMEGSGGFMNQGSASAPGPLLIGHEYRLAGRHLGSLPGRGARLLLGGSELSDVTFETTQTTFRIPANADEGSTTLTIEAPGGAVSVPVELAAPRALAQATGATFVRGDPPVSGGQVFGGATDPATPGGQYAGEIVVAGWPGPDCGLELVPSNFYGGYMQTTAQAQRVGDRFFVTTRHVTQPTSASLRLMNLAPGSDASVSLYVLPRPAEPASVALEHAAVVGGNEVDVTVAVDYPSTQAVLEVSSSDPSVVVAPATITADRSTVTFPVRTQRVDARDIVTITISGQDQTVSTELSVSPQPIRMAEVTIEPNPVLGGSVVEGTVRMTGMTSQTPPIDVALISDNKDVGVPATVKVTAGIGRFEVRTAAVSAPTKAAIEARSQYGTAVGAFGIRPLEVSSVSVDPATLRQGQSSTLTVELPGAVQMDLPLDLVISDPTALAIQGRPLFRAGQSRLQLPLAVSRAAKPGTVTIEILLPGQSRGAGRIVEVTIVG